MATDPIRTLELALIDKRPVPFEWVVEYAPDSDLRNVWRASTDPVSMVSVAQRCGVDHRELAKVSLRCASELVWKLPREVSGPRAAVLALRAALDGKDVDMEEAWDACHRATCAARRWRDHDICEVVESALEDQASPREGYTSQTVQRAVNTLGGKTAGKKIAGWVRAVLPDPPSWDAIERASRP